MSRRKTSVFLTVGIILLILSATAIAVLQVRIFIGEKRCISVAARLEELLPERTVGTPEDYTGVDMPVLELDGVDYVAILEVPSFGISVPVADKWSSRGLFDTPARFYGSAYEHSLVIGGADVAHQLYFCDKIDNGAELTVVDMTGVSFSYTVTKVERSKSADIDRLSEGEHSLTLFCRDTYSMEYVLVRCDPGYR